MSTATDTKQDNKIAKAIATYAAQFAGFAQSVQTLDEAKSAYTEKAQAYETAKGAAADALVKAMSACGYKSEGFPTADAKREFMTAWKGSLGKPYASSTQDRLWQELCTAATNKFNQKFGVHNPESQRKAKSREELAKSQKDALKKLGIDEHSAPVNLRQKAAELAIQDPATSAMLLTEAINREAKQVRAKQEAEQTVLKNKRELLRGMIANANMEQLDALLATAKTVKLAPKEAPKK